MTKIMNFLPLFALAAVLSLASCGENLFYDQLKDIPATGWTYRDTADFRFNISDTSVLYNLFAEVIYADTFSTQNLYVKLYTRFPDGKRPGKPCSFDLFNAVGAPNGKCSGGVCRVRIQLQERTVFRQPGEYCITMEQFMRHESVTGIRKVGLAIEKTETKRSFKK